MTQKLSGARVSTTFTINCNASRLVTPLNPYLLKVYSINKISLNDYIEKLNASSGDILYELHHDYISSNEISATAPFDQGNILSLSGFVDVVNDTENPSRNPSAAFTGNFTIIKSYPSSTIIKLNIEPINTKELSRLTFISNAIELGYMRYDYPYRLLITSTVSCTPVPSPIVPNLTLNFETLEIPWVPNESYTIQVNSGVVKHEFGEQYSNPQFSIPFTTNQPPTVGSVYTGSFNLSEPPAVILANTNNGLLLKGNYSKLNSLLIINWIREVIHLNGTINLYGKPTGSTETPSLVKSWNARYYQTVSPIGANYEPTLDPTWDFNFQQSILAGLTGLLKEDHTYTLNVTSAVVRDRDGFTSVAATPAAQFQTDSVNFPGLKANIVCLSALSDIGVRIRRSTAAFTSTATMVVSGQIVNRALLYSAFTLTASGSYKLTLTAGNTNYITNSSNSGFFDADTIRDRDVGATYQVRISSPHGAFGDNSMTSGPVANNTIYYLNGNLASIKSQMSGVYFWPEKNYASNTAYTIQVYRDGVLSASASGTAYNNGTNVINNLYTFTSSNTWTPTAIERYYGEMDYLIIGGGGAGAQSPFGSSAQGTSGGGAAGQVLVYLNQQITNLSYPYVIGNGGTWTSQELTDRSSSIWQNGNSSYWTAPSGTSTRFNGIYAYGGGGGIGGWIYGGEFSTLVPNGGYNLSYTGGLGNQIFDYSNPENIIGPYSNGGGGAGSLSNGGSANSSAINFNFSTYGIGGTGTSNSITGNVVEYGQGGDGTPGGGYYPIGFVTSTSSTTNRVSIDPQTNKIAFHNMPIKLASSIGGLSQGVTYYIIGSSITYNTDNPQRVISFQVSDTPNGSAKTLTTATPSNAVGYTTGPRRTVTYGSGGGGSYTVTNLYYPAQNGINGAVIVRVHI